MTSLHQACETIHSKLSESVRILFSGTKICETKDKQEKVTPQELLSDCRQKAFRMVTF